MIRGYTALIDEKLAGFDVQAMISIRLEHPKYNQEFNQRMQEHPSVLDCFYITGDFDYIARIGVSTTEELTKVLHDIKEIPGVSLTRTFVVLENVKQSAAGFPGVHQLLDK